MKLRRTTVGVAALVMMSTWGVGAAWAAAPSNDTIGGATAIPGLPYDDSVDVSQATADSLDASLNQQCGAPATQGSIWYTYTAPATGVGGLVLDVSHSSYSSGVIVAESDGAGGFTVDACGPGTVGVQVRPGTVYSILAFNDMPGQSGGFIKLHAEAAAIPTINVKVNPTGKVDRYGNALISGVYTCSNGSFVSLQTDVKQSVGRFAIQGSGFTGSEVCDGLSHPWTSVVTPFNGKFAGGKSATFTYGFTCGNFFCSETFVSQVVKLSK